jgi:hypothetical protein
MGAWHQDWLADWLSVVMWLRLRSELNMQIAFRILSWNITPCSAWKVNRRHGGTYRFHLQGWISLANYQRESRNKVDCLFDPWDGSYISYETSIEFPWTKWRYIPHYRALHKHRCDNLKSYVCYSDYKFQNCEEIARISGSWNSDIGSRVPWDSKSRMTVLARVSRNFSRHSASSNQNVCPIVAFPVTRMVFHPNAIEFPRNRKPILRSKALVSHR